MPLTPAEREAGRAFRQLRQELLATLNREDPPVVTCSPWSPPFLRHDCRERPGGTLAMPLRELHADSPDGRFRFTWLEGRCHHCRLLARSSSGCVTIL